MRDVERQDKDRIDETDGVATMDRMDTPDRVDTVHRDETLTTEEFPAGARDADPLPADPFTTAPGTAESKPVDESGLETGGNVVPEQRPELGTDHDAVQNADHDTVPSTVPNTDRHTAPDAELFSGDTVSQLRARWRELQADFVDDPQRAVQEADNVLDEVLRTITEHRERLAGEWQGHTDTEELRLAMQGYRSFFDRLLPKT